MDIVDGHFDKLSTRGWVEHSLNKFHMDLGWVDRFYKKTLWIIKISLKNNYVN